MPEQAVLFAAADGSPLRGVWTTPEGPGPFPGVLCVHGLTLTKALFDGFAGTLESRGVASFRIDLRGHGESGGLLKDQGFDDQCSDARAGLETMSRLKGADQERMGYLGFSMGGAMGAVVASSLPLKSLALWSPLLRTGLWSGRRREEYGVPQDGFRPIWDGILVNERLFSEALVHDPFASAAGWPGPVLVCHGGKDRNHPQSAGRELAAVRADSALPVASYFPPSSGHRWHSEGDCRLRDALSAAFFEGTL